MAGVAVRRGRSDVIGALAAVSAMWLNRGTQIPHVRAVRGRSPRRPTRLEGDAMRDGDPRLDGLVDAYVGRRIDRREFLRRAGALGVALPVASAVLAACGGSDAATTSGG